MKKFASSRGKEMVHFNLSDQFEPFFQWFNLITDFQDHISGEISHLVSEFEKKRIPMNQMNSLGEIGEIHEKVLTLFPHFQKSLEENKPEIISRIDNISAEVTAFLEKQQLKDVENEKMMIIRNEEFESEKKRIEEECVEKEKKVVEGFLQKYEVVDETYRIEEKKEDGESDGKELVEEKKGEIEKVEENEKKIEDENKDGEEGEKIEEKEGAKEKSEQA